MSRPSRRALVAAGILGALCGGLPDGVQAQGSGGCRKDTKKGYSEQTISVTDPNIGRIERSYHLYVPREYNSFLSTAVVIDFHGYYGTSDNQAEESGIMRISDEYNFIAVWPQGLDDTVIPGQQAYSWNAVGTVSSPGSYGETCKWAARKEWNGYPCHSSCRPTRGCLSDRDADGCDCATCADDVLFVELLLNELQSTLCVDQSRVFLTGMSNGAMMVYQLAQSRIASRFAAIVPVAGSPLLGFGAKPAVPMPIMEIHGSKDDIIPANVSGSYRGEKGPHGSTVSSDGFYYEPVDWTMERYADASGCAGGPARYETAFDGVSALWCVQPHGPCSRGGPVVRCSHNKGHTWPFASGASGRTQFALLAWEFMSFSADSKAKAAASSANATRARAPGAVRQEA